MTTSLTYEDFPALTGRQEPHHVSVQLGDETDGRKAIELSRRIGRLLMPWQGSSMNAILSRTGTGVWTHSDVCLICPRQNGKSLILVLRCLYGLFELGEDIIYTSQLWPTAEDAYKTLWGLIKARPSLRKRVVKNTCSQGKGFIELSNGAKIVFCTRSNDSGRGFSKVDLIVFDEAYNLTDGEIAALNPTQMAAQDPQTIYASSAVNLDQHTNGEVLASVRQRGLDGEDGLYFAEYMAPEEMDREDEATWQYANPSYGVIHTAAKIRKLMRGFKTPAGRKTFDVEALGRGDWPVEEGELPTWTVVPREHWLGGVDHDPVLVGPRAVALHRSVDRSTWMVAAAQRTVEGRIHVEIGYILTGRNAEVVDLLELLVEVWDPCVIATDRKSPAAVLEQALLDKGIELVMSTAPQMVGACSGWVDDAKDALLSHTGQQVLTDAVEGAQKRTLPQGDWAISQTSGVDATSFITAILARWALTVFGGRAPGPSAMPAVFEDHRHRAGAGAEFDVLSAAF